MVERAALPVMLTGFDDAWSRLDARLAGLTQAEYLWEPVEHGWTVRETPEGWLADWESPDPDPSPVTTIAWRLWHVASDCLADYLRHSDVPRPIPVAGRAWYGEVEPALDALRASATAFRSTMAGLGDEGIWEPMGPLWGRYGEEPWAALLVHASDELAHHGAEIALLRDLWRWRAGV